MPQISGIEWDADCVSTPGEVREVRFPAWRVGGTLMNVPCLLRAESARPQADPWPLGRVWQRRQRVSSRLLDPSSRLFRGGAFVDPHVVFQRGLDVGMAHNLL